MGVGVSADWEGLLPSLGHQKDTRTELVRSLVTSDNLTLRQQETLAKLCHLWPQFPHPMAFCGGCGESPLSLPPSLPAWGTPSQHLFFPFLLASSTGQTDGAQRASGPLSLRASLCPAPDTRHLA